MKEVIIETIIDSLKLLPFLFLAFLIIELFEHKFSKKNQKILKKSGRLGPILGSILGIIPQCGFSVLATNLYVTRIISLGTLFAVYLATSDEMLPLLIANGAPLSLMLKILGIKFVLGMLFGFLIDLIIKKKDSLNYEICQEDHCNCKDGIMLASLKHTLNIFVFIFICTFIINIILEFLGGEYLEKIFLKDNIFGAVLTSLIGLIPNCGSSVILTELFLSSSISFGALIGGLLTGSGVALLVLFKINHDKKESLKILLGLYLIGALCGIIIDILIKIM